MTTVVQPDPSSEGTFRVMVHSLAGTNPVGPRLIHSRTVEFPAGEWKGLSREVAEKQAKDLQKALDIQAGVKERKVKAAKKSGIPLKEWDVVDIPEEGK